MDLKGVVHDINRVTDGSEGSTHVAGRMVLPQLDMGP